MSEFRVAQLQQKPCGQDNKRKLPYVVNRVGSSFTLSKPMIRIRSQLVISIAAFQMHTELTAITVNAVVAYSSIGTQLVPTGGPGLYRRL